MLRYGRCRRDEAMTVGRRFAACRAAAYVFHGSMAFEEAVRGGWSPDMKAAEHLVKLRSQK